MGESFGIDFFLSQVQIMVVVNANVLAEVAVKVKPPTNATARRNILLVKIPDEKDEVNMVRNFRKHLRKNAVEMVGKFIKFFSHFCLIRVFITSIYFLGVFRVTIFIIILLM